MNNKKRAILLLVTISFAINYIQAQVTIGSSNIPLPGALLYLQEQDYSDGTNARKGLMLPRVKLTDMKNLYPMFGSGYNKTEMDPLHIGLTVYHVEEGVECPTALSGVYTWGGEDWIPLAVADTENDPTQPQPTFTDNEGNTYTYKKYGGKYWMTQNVRSRYQGGDNSNRPIFVGSVVKPRINPARNRTPISESKSSVDLIYSDGTNLGSIVAIPYGTIIYRENNEDIILSYEEYVERFGLLYTYALAVQACPTGWTIPTDDDWLDLIRVVDNNPSATIAANEAGVKMKANNHLYTSADPNDTSVTPNQPVSYYWSGCITKNVGFNAYPNGYIQNAGTRGVYFAEKVQYWATELSDPTSGLFYSIDYKAHLKGVFATRNPGYYNSVRCVRDTPPN